MSRLGRRTTAARPSRGQVAALDPGYFALVMATGIVSTGVRIARAPALSAALLVITIVCYLALVAAYAWRWIRHRGEFLADAAEPRKAFAFFSFVAGSDVLGSRLAVAGYPGATVGLLVVAGLAWVVLSYGMVLGLVARDGGSPALAGVNGTWFLWAVGTQSIAVSTASLPWQSAATVAVVVVFWSVGVVLYLLIAGLALAGLFQSPDPEALTPAYWVFMGATAISVLAGGKLLVLPPDPLGSAMRPVAAGLSFALWAFGTFLVPLIILLGVWRHLIRRIPLRYQPSLWSMVFPLGMYCVGSGALGSAIGVRWLTVLGRYGIWVGFTVWALVFAAMLASFAGLPPGATPGAAAPPGGAERFHGGPGRFRGGASSLVSPLAARRGTGRRGR